MIKHENGTGFFWMGDTAWYLAYKLEKEEIEQYLNDRAKKKYSVIQMIAIEKPGTLNANGDAPFIDKYYAEFNEDYWEHIDYIIKKAKAKGLYVALLPTWREHITSKDDAITYGKKIANRYKDEPNIIWVIGGDTRDFSDQRKQIWENLAKAIKSVDTNHLMTFHPSRYITDESAKWLHNQDWLDLNMFQSGHGYSSTTEANKKIENSYNRTNPIKPAIDGEPRYETIKKRDGSNSNYGFNAYDVRSIAYLHLFSGAFGHTYGHHSIWQMHKAEDTTCSYGECTVYWDEALNADGSKQMQYIAELMRSRPILKRVPDQSLIENGNATATRGDGYAFIYLPLGNTVSINMGKISGSKVRGWWYNPRDGSVIKIDTFVNSGTSSFDPPENGKDWVLVLDDISKGYGEPGENN